MAATSASDRLRSGVASATPGSAGSDPRETAGTNECWSGLEGDQNPWKDRDVAPRKRGADITDSSVEQGLEADRQDPCGDTRFMRGRRAAAGTSYDPWGIVRVSTDSTGVEEGWQTPPRRNTAPGGNGREAASAGGPSEPPPTLIRRSRRVSPPFAAGFCNLRPRWLQKGRTKRRGGNDRSDAERLPTRIKPSKGLRCEDPGRLPLLQERSRPATRLETSVSVAWWT
jgi:hypothetical protein